MEDITKILLDQLKAINDKLDGVTESISKIEAKNDCQDKDIETLKAELKSLKEEQTILKNEINGLNSKEDKKKAGRWDSLINNVIKIVITIVSTWALIKLGLK